MRLTIAAALMLAATPTLSQELHACGAPQPTANTAPFDVTGPVIHDEPAVNLVGYEGAFEPASGDLTIDALWAKFGATDQWIKGAVAPVGYGVCHDGYTYFAGTPVAAGSPLPNGFAALALPAQTYAVYTHTGLAWSIPNARAKIEAEAPPRGFSFSDGPEIEFYPEDYSPTSPDATMEIWLPVTALP